MGIVAIVGRPNVGKSTLFNRLVGMRQAIVDETAGVTRDRHYGKSEWCGKEFSVVDTGGYTSNSDDIFEGEIRKQVSLAIEEADVILFLCEVATGITDYDSEIAAILRRCKKPVILAVNKVDTGDKMYGAYEFNALGLGEPYCIAAASGGGTGDLLDKICELLPDDNNVVIDHEDESIPRITIVGKPNVGKSSMTNALLGEERNIVTNIAGTTRDSISTRYNKFGYDFMLVDTAGLRKKNRVKEDLEFYSVMLPPQMPLPPKNGTTITTAAAETRAMAEKRITHNIKTSVPNSVRSFNLSFLLPVLPDEYVPLFD